MFVAILAALALGSPAPSASPLKQIIEVRSKNALCATLEQTARPVLVGLMQDDRAIDAGQRALAKSLQDSSDGVDLLRAENASIELVHNLAFIDGLLADAKRFPANPQNDEERTADEIKADLESVVASQKQKLNAIYGTMDSYELGAMRSGYPLFNPRVGPGADELVPDMQATPVQTPPPIASTVGATVVTSPKETTASLEDRASVEILNAAATCASAR